MREKRKEGKERKARKDGTLGGVAAHWRGVSGKNYKIEPGRDVGQ